MMLKKEEEKYLKNEKIKEDKIIKSKMNLKILMKC